MAFFVVAIAFSAGLFALQLNAPEQPPACPPVEQRDALGIPPELIGEVL